MSLSEFFNHVTYDFDEIVISLAVGTAKKREGSKYTAFQFRGKESKILAGNSIKLCPCLGLEIYRQSPISISILVIVLFLSQEASRGPFWPQVRSYVAFINDQTFYWAVTAMINNLSLTLSYDFLSLTFCC